MDINTVTAEEIQTYVAAALTDIGCDLDEFAPADDLVCDLGMDSTEIVELGIVLREKLGLSVRVDLRGLDTAGDVIEKVQQILAT